MVASIICMTEMFDLLVSLLHRPWALNNYGATQFSPTDNGLISNLLFNYMGSHMQNPPDFVSFVTHIEYQLTQVTIIMDNKMFVKRTLQTS